MKKIFQNCEGEGISRSCRLRLRGAIPVLSTILALSLESHAHAQTNASLQLREALDDTNLVWSTSGTAAWGLQFDETHDGADAAQGGPLQAGVVGVVSGIGTSVIGPGTLSFWWKIEDTNCFELNFSVGTNGVATNGPWPSGSTNWEQQIFRIPPGSQNLTWVFQTMCGDGSPPGSAWLDEVKYIPDGPALAVLSHNSDSLSVEVTGSAGIRVQAEFSMDLLSWAPFPLAQLTLEDGRGVLQVPKSGSKAFYRVITVP